MAGGAREDRIAVLRIDEDFCDVLGIVQPDRGPVLAAVSGFVNAISDRDAVSHPRLARSHPNNLGIGMINRDGANRLHRLAVKYRLEGGPPVDRLPDTSAGGADEYTQAAIFSHSVHGGDAAADGGGADVAGRQAGNCGSIELDRLLRRQG